MSRRKFLIASGITGIAGAYFYNETIQKIIKPQTKTNDSIYANSLNPKIGKYYSSVCNGCVTHCGVRVKILDNKVLKVIGNPYSLLSSDPWLNMNTSIKDSYLLTNQGKIHSSVCARGNLVFDKLNDKARVTKILKRVGKRGENKWQSIEPDKFLDEIVNGGDLFNEGYVKGFKEVYNHTDLIDENAPEFGKKANGLCIIATGDEGRKNFFQERFQKSFGTINFHGHTATCGLSMRAGMAAFLNDFDKYPHLKPDFDNCEFLINFASAPAQAGNPFKRQGLKIANRKSNNLEYATITPILTNSTSSASSVGKWIAIKPGGDLFLALALLQDVINQKIYDEEYLSYTNLNENNVSFSNAAYLVVEDDYKNYKKGEFLRINNEIMVINEQGLISAKDCKKANIYYDGIITLDDEAIKVKTSFIKLKESVNSNSLDDLLQNSGVSKKDYEYLLEKIKKYKNKVAFDLHGGTMQTNGFYTAYAILELVGLLGNLNKIGGMSAGGGKYNDLSGDFELAKYKGKIKPSGIRVDKTKKPYEATSEYKNKIKNNENPYPSKLPWYPLTNAICTDAITNAALKYPYGIDILLSWNANIAYASNMNNVKNSLKDSSKIPLFIAIDPFINETSMFADYIVPDSVMYETWGVVNPWGGALSKASHFRFPILNSPNVKFSNNEIVYMDSFIIELGKKLGLAGFGKNAISDSEGNLFDLDKPSDYYLRSFINVALDGGFDYEINEDEIKDLPFIQELKEISPKHYKKALFCMARGGKFESKNKAYNKNSLAKTYKKEVAIYNEDLALTKDSLTGKNYSGVPYFVKQRFKNNTTLDELNLKAFSYKSNIYSSLVAASSKLTHLKYSNYIELHEDTAAKLGLKDKDLIKVIRDDKKIIGILKTRKGIHKEAVGIEHSRARRGEGASDFYIDGKLIAKNISKRTGVSISNIIPDDTIRGENALISDFVVGSVARQGFGVIIEKISSLG